MFTKEFYDVLIQTVKSWQVIAAAVAVLLYLKIVSYVSRGYHRPKRKKVNRKSKKNEPAQLSVPEEGETGSNSNDELGLEEA
jgi:hypothetical protein